MSTLKTLENDASVEDFLNSMPEDTKRQDGFALLEMFSRITGEKPVMWGAAIVGFGKYHYKSERSKQEGDWPLIAFSPRKQNLTLYIMPGPDSYADLIGKLGKCKTSVGCLYINKLADVDTGVLEKLVNQAFIDMKKQHT